MLVTERTSDGRTVVRLHKDWNPSRINKHLIIRKSNYHERNRPNQKSSRRNHAA